MPVPDQDHQARPTLLERLQRALRDQITLPPRVHAFVSDYPVAVPAVAAAAGLLVGWTVLGAFLPPPWARQNGISGFGRLPGALAVGALAAVAASAVAVLTPRFRARTGRGRRARLAERVELGERVGSGGQRIAPASPETPQRANQPPQDAQVGIAPGAAPTRAVTSAAVPPVARIPAFDPRQGSSSGSPPPASTQPTEATASEAPESGWQPEHVHLGRTLSTRYLGPDARFYRTWLVYDDDGGLVGGSGLRARRTGEIETLELWFFQRDDAPDSADPPFVALATPRAAGRMDVPVITAVAGHHFTLKTGGLVLLALVVDAVPDDSGLAFRTLTLDLCATQKQDDQA